MAKSLSFTRPAPSYEGAARGNVNDRLALDRHFNERIADLEKKTGGSSFDLTKVRPAATAPKPAQITVETQPGKFIVQLSNVDNNVNAPVQHILDFSDTANFSKVQSISVGTQSYIEVGRYPNGSSKYIRVRSSLDGTNYSIPRVAGLHTV